MPHFLLKAQYLKIIELSVKKKREDFFLQLSESDNVMSLSIKAFSPNIMAFSATYSKI